MRYVRRGKHIYRRYPPKEAQAKVLTLLTRKPRTLRQLSSCVGRSPSRTRFYLRRIQRSSRVRAKGRVQRIGLYYHYLPIMEVPSREALPPARVDLRPYVFRASFNSPPLGAVALELDVCISFQRNVCVPESQDPALLRIRNEVEDRIKWKFGTRQGEAILRSNNFGCSVLPLEEGESVVTRAVWRSNGGTWHDL